MKHAPPPGAPRKRTMGWRRALGWTALALLLAAALSLGLAYRASQQVPEFYQAALAHDPAAQRKAGDDLERRALDLRNEAQHSGRWQARFTEDELNGWLAVDLVEKFPDLLPKELNSPRVALVEGEILVGCKYKTDRLETVVSLALTAALTDEPNVVAVRIKRARAGALPLPIKQYLDEVARAAQSSQLDIRWTQDGGDAVALVRLPEDKFSLPERSLRLETLDLRPGEVELSGRTQWQGNPAGR